ncbi:serine-rich adhesin for platelets-like [Palaemon carinicauda]|uniref:serine-rich adhesin for platelets-like n=1 Tax=Palaemon carinicauda TaxID=392227 RepID=UPI0035B5BD99
MWHSGCETVNPHVRAQGRLWRDLGGMEGVMFPPVPDRSLKGTNARFPPPPDSSSPDSILPKRNTSFLWNKNIQGSIDLDGSFDQDSFFQMHKHLLAESDQSTELEKSLYERRKGIAGTYSTLESKTHSEFTSAHETQLYAGMTTPYDELTYEETLFEVKVDGVKPPIVEKMESPLPQTSEEETALQNFLKQRQLSTRNKRNLPKLEPKKLQSDVDMLSNGTEEKGYPKKSNIPRRNPSLAPQSGLDRPRLKLRSESLRNGHSGHHHHRSVENKHNYDGMLSEGLIKSYIEERIKAVERQIRMEVTEEAHMRKHTRPKPKTPFPDMSSANAPTPGPSNSSSKEFILREIAAVLAAKGYLPSVQAQNQGLLKFTESSHFNELHDKGHLDRDDTLRPGSSITSSKLGKVQRYKAASPRSSPLRARKGGQNSASSTYKSHKESNRDTSLRSIQDSPKSKRSSHFSTHSVAEVADLKRRKRKTNGSRSSLTSLLRTQDSSSSDTDLANTFRSRQQSIISKISTTHAHPSDMGNNCSDNQGNLKQGIYASPSFPANEQSTSLNESNKTHDEKPPQVVHSEKNIENPQPLPGLKNVVEVKTEQVSATTTPSKPSEETSNAAPELAPKANRRIPPPRPPAPSIPIYQSISPSGSSHYQQIQGQVLTATKLLPPVIPPKGPPPPVPKRPKRIWNPHSKPELPLPAKLSSSVPAAPEAKILPSVKENKTYVSKEEVSVTSSPSESPVSKATTTSTIESENTTDTGITCITNQTQETQLSLTQETVEKDPSEESKEAAKDSASGSPQRVSRDQHVAGSRGDCREGSPQQSSPTRQSLGRSSATSHHNEDRSETDYFLMDDHTAGRPTSHEREGVFVWPTPQVAIALSGLTVSNGTQRCRLVGSSEECVGPEPSAMFIPLPHSHSPSLPLSLTPTLPPSLSLPPTVLIMKERTGGLREYPDFMVVQILHFRISTSHASERIASSNHDWGSSQIWGRACAVRRLSSRLKTSYQKTEDYLISPRHSFSGFTGKEFILAPGVGGGLQI